VSILYAASGVLTVALLVYLLYALFRPEKF
jgi:K+-transporting ATPase KdpF subunit